MLTTGSVWGSMRLKSIESEKIFDLNERGEPYFTGEYGPRIYVMECKCGREVRIAAHEFPGKWNMRFCGEPSCEFSPEALKAKKREINAGAKRPVGRPPSEDPSASMVLSMPISVLNKVRDAALERGMSVSKRVGDLVNKGLAWELEHADD